MISLVISPQLKWKRANLDKYRAHAAVRQALRDGRLTRGKCIDCGSLRVEAHHPRGYGPDHILDIEWVCRRDHKKRHRKGAAR